MSNISVIIPTYNRCALLKRALESIYRQTFSVFEILVIDDGSTDNTAEMISTHFPHVIYIKQTNKGVSSARNKGLREVKGEWIAFLDSDDEWLAPKLEKQRELLHLNPEYKICHTQEQWIRNGEKVNQMKKHKKAGGWIFSQCLPLCAMSPSSILIHHSVFEEVGMFDTDLPACEDYDLWLRITAKFPVLFVEQPMINKYGGHDDQLSMKYWGMDRYRIQALQNIIQSDMLNHKNKQEAVQMLLKKCKIFKNGALKRGKTESAQAYQQIIESYVINE